MAAITISSPGGAQINPRSPFVPYNNNGVFSDSMLTQSDDYTFFTALNAGNENDVTGLLINNHLGSYQFGDFQGVLNNSFIEIDWNTGSIKNWTSADYEINLLTDGQIKLNGSITAASAGGSAGLHLELIINGTLYKIALLNA